MIDLFQSTKDFCENNPSLNSIMKHLRSGEEIAVKVDGKTDATLIFQQKKNHLLNRKARSPNIEIEIKAELIRRLNSLQYASLKKLVIEASRETLLGNISIKIKRPFTHLLTHGYLKFFIKIRPYLSDHIKSLSIKKILSKIKSR